jgi:hypothetical protein
VIHEADSSQLPIVGLTADLNTFGGLLGLWIGGLVDWSAHACVPRCNEIVWLGQFCVCGEQRGEGK